MSLLQYAAQKKAIQFGEDLMPNNCFDILISVYGEARLDNMLPATIVDKILHMMATVAVDALDDYKEWCEDIVKQWINQF